MNCICIISVYIYVLYIYVDIFTDFAFLRIADVVITCCAASVFIKQKITNYFNCVQLVYIYSGKYCANL